VPQRVVEHPQRDAPWYRPAICSRDSDPDANMSVIGSSADHGASSADGRPNVVPK
jgi:hypothetical protein